MQKIATTNLPLVKLNMDNFLNTLEGCNLCAKHGIRSKEYLTAKAAWMAGKGKKMSEIKVPGTLDSREVAEMVGKSHGNLMRDIATYIAYMKESTQSESGFSGESTEIKIDSSDFFIESTYQDSTGRTLPCYLITKKGCEMIANKLTGAKGIQFTAQYVNRFNAMEEGYKALGSNASDKLLRAQAMLTNAKTRQAALMLKMADDERLSSEAVELLKVGAAQICTGKVIAYRPKLEEGKHYTATEIAEEAGCTSMRVGMVSNAQEMKTAEYGKYILDKKKYSDGQTDAFVYNERGRAKLLELLVAGGYAPRFVQ